MPRISCDWVADLIHSPRCAAALRRGMPRISMMISARASSATLRVFVITSYSIHYTKLYDNPLDALSGLRATGVELILGTNADEWLMYLEPDTSLADLESWIARHPDPEGLRASVADLPDPRRVLDRLETFLNMECPSRLLAEWANASYNFV